MEYVLTTSGLSKKYGKFKALDDLSMHIPKGAIYGFVGRNGDVHMQFEPDWDTERLVENKKYVDSPLRNIYEAVNNILPYSHFNDAESVVSNWFGYNDLNSGGDTWDNSANLKVTKESNQMLTYNLIYSAAVLLAISGVGYICFRKKDLK